MRGFSSRGQTYRGSFSKCTLSKYHQGRRWLIRVYLDFPDWGQLLVFRYQLPRPRLCWLVSDWLLDPPQLLVRLPPRILCRCSSSPKSTVVNRMIWRAMVVSRLYSRYLWYAVVHLYRYRLPNDPESPLLSLIHRYVDKFRIFISYIFLCKIQL